MRIRTFFSLLVFLFCFSVINSFAAVDQTFVERILKENREFVDFIDTCVTNFAPDKKNDLFNIYQKHFNAEVAFLQGEYQRAFNNIYDSQKDMVTLYEFILTEYYLEDSKNILDGNAPNIIRSKNVSAKQYLTLGYRDRTLARTYYTVGEASHPKLYSYKIYKYRDAINMARRAKRYGFISLYTGQTGKVKLTIYNQLFKSENEKGSIFFKRFVDKNEKDYIQEINKIYEKYEEETAQAEKADNKKTDITASEGTKEEKSKDTTETVVFEKKMEREVRFRKEQRVAQYILNEEFDKAEAIIRTYVEDYNYKLIMATLITLGSGESHTAEGDAKKADKNDYKKYIRDHNDNYNILNDKSILESVIGDVKVVDSVKKEDRKLKDDEKIEGGSKKVSEAEMKKIEEENKTDVNAKKPSDADTKKNENK